MTRRDAKGWLTWLLPLLLCRLLWPAGVMAQAGPQGLRLVMCSGRVLPAHQDEAPGGALTGHADMPCAFAVASAAAPPPALTQPPQAPAAPLLLAPTPSPAATAGFGPRRAQSSRGPPGTA